VKSEPVVEVLDAEVDIRTLADSGGISHWASSGVKSKPGGFGIGILDSLVEDVAGLGIFGMDAVLVEKKMGNSWTSR
jgi:hypothetical protein